MAEGAGCAGEGKLAEEEERGGSLETLNSPSTPEDTVKYPCKICHKKYANVYRLQRHMLSHDETAHLRQFKCKQCDRAFTFKFRLKEHLREHSGEEPFECQ